MPPRHGIELRVTGTHGQVERGDLAGSWTPLSAGDQLRPDEQVRTGAGAGADLAAGERSHLSIGERTQLAVRELTDAVHRYRLARGVVAVDYLLDGDRRVRIEGAAEGAPVAEARGARFYVVAGELSFAVANEAGEVTLTAAGSTVPVPAGLASHVLAEGPPSLPAQIPTAVLLKVAEASRVGPANHCADGIGRADPWALVTVDDADVAVGADGRFPVRGPRSEAEVVAIRAVLPDGRSAVHTFRCRKDSEANIHDLHVRWRKGGG